MSTFAVSRPRRHLNWIDATFAARSRIVERD
jgi:hypothetical protein